MLPILINAVAIILITAGERRRPSERSRSREWLRPPAGSEFVAPDGSLITGILIVADNTPVLMIAARHTPPRPAAASPLDPF